MYINLSFIVLSLKLPEYMQFNYSELIDIIFP